MTTLADLLKGEVPLSGAPTKSEKPSKLAELLRSVARGAPQAVTGFVDLAALPLTATGMIEPKDVVGSTEYLTRLGLLPKPQPGLANQTTEVLSGGLMPLSPAAMRQTIAGAKSLAPKAYDALEDYMTKTGGMAFATPNQKLAQALRNEPIGGNFDPRFDPRKLERERLETMRPKLEQYNKNEAPNLYLPDLEGTPFVTSMSDRTGAGAYLLGIDDVNFNRPVDLLGGKDYMFNNPNVWASAKGPVKQIMKKAGELKKETGKDPLFIPWGMAPTGGDFAHMTGETMLAYAEAAMPKSTKKELNGMIKTMIPDWKGIDSSESIEQFRKAKDSVRKAIKGQMDVYFRDKGGIGIGQARLAVADPKQLDTPDGMVSNVGRIFSDQPTGASTHPAYPVYVPGEGMGRIPQQHNIVEMLPNFVKERNIPDPKNPRQTDIRALQMKPYGGIIDEQLLKSLGY